MLLIASTNGEHHFIEGKSLCLLVIILLRFLVSKDQKKKILLTVTKDHIHISDGILKLLTLPRVTSLTGKQQVSGQC